MGPANGGLFDPSGDLSLLTKRLLWEYLWLGVVALRVDNEGQAPPVGVWLATTDYPHTVRGRGHSLPHRTGAASRMGNAAASIRLGLVGLGWMRAGPRCAPQEVQRVRSLL